MDAHKNFAYSTVATAPSPAISGTSLVVVAGDGAKFPATSFNAIVCPAGTQPTAANAEVVRVTGISTDTFTITRTQETSSARTIGVGDQIFAAITAKTLTDIEGTTLDAWAAPAANVAMNAKKITGLAVATAATDAASLANSLDQFTAPAANVAMNAKKITGLAYGAAATDAMAVGQLARSAPGGLVNAAIAATLPRYVALSGTLALVSGTLFLVGIELPAGKPINSITFVSAFGGAINTGTHQIFGIFDDSLGSSSGTPYAQLAVTNDDTNTAWAQNTIKTLNLTGAYTPTRSGFHYLGILCVATTAPSLRATTADSVIGALASILCGASSTGLTALPNPAIAPTYGGGTYPGAWVS